MRILKTHHFIASAGAFLLSLGSLHANFTDLSGLNGKKVVLQKDYHLQYIDSTKGGEKSVLLPIPLSVIVRSVFSSSTTATPTT